MQAVSRALYNHIMSDSQFTYFNTLKFFELYYKKRLFAVFLFPYIHPRFSFRLGQSPPAGGADQQQQQEQHNKPSADSGNDEGCGNTPLHIAAANAVYVPIQTFFQTEAKGHLNYPSFTMRYLFNQQASKQLYLRENNATCSLLNLENEEPNTMLHYISIVPEDVDDNLVIETARKLIHVGADLWRKGRAGNTVLAEAAQHGHLNMVKMLIEEVERHFDFNKEQVAAYINTYNNYHENAVIMAARSSPQVLELLLKKGGDPNSTRRGYPLISILASGFRFDRRDPLTFESYHRQRTTRWGMPWPRMTDQPDEEYQENASHAAVLALLLQSGADPRLPETATGMTPLQVAAFWGDVQAADILMRVGGVDPNTDVNAKTGWLAVHYAASEGQIFALESLVHAGAVLWDESSPVDGVVEGVPYVRQGIPSPMEVLAFDPIKTKLMKLAQMCSKNRK